MFKIGVSCPEIMFSGSEVSMDRQTTRWTSQHEIMSCSLRLQGVTKNQAKNLKQSKTLRKREKRQGRNTLEEKKVEARWSKHLGREILEVRWKSQEYMSSMQKTAAQNVALPLTLGIWALYLHTPCTHVSPFHKAVLQTKGGGTMQVGGGYTMPGSTRNRKNRAPCAFTQFTCCMGVGRGTHDFAFTQSLWLLR